MSASPSLSTAKPCDGASIAHLYSCTVDGTRVTSHVLSCDADDATAAVHRHAREAVAAAADVPCECDYITKVSLQPTHADAPPVDDHRWMSKHMARSCGPDFNPNRVTTHNHFSCNYVGEGVVDGRKVSNPLKTWKGRLAACSEDGLEISDELMRDIKEYAYAAAGGDEFQLDIDKFVCGVTTIPQL